MVKKGFRKATEHEEAMFALGKLVGMTYKYAPPSWENPFDKENYKAYTVLHKYIMKMRDKLEVKK